MEINILSEELLYKSKPFEVSMAFNLEGYPNRDSTKYEIYFRYIELYDL